ncbi:phosphoenolpyruvate pyruvate domain protein [Fusarium beomiforme]|uniref:Phosphoenolpyruvate pyruvate domain protein n=1 Tax=Fusarium beomiforme TaxID=44412 RepID=A0A9P5AJB9_9HYPO|nr:phosphoenolpyruvate pyruvate domain protein [Fusarium beomiforme]
MAACTNSLSTNIAAGQLCKAFGIKFSTNPQVVQLAKNSGFDSLFIDLEHSTLSIDDVSQLCCAGLLAGITPFVRVPYQCGNGFVQRVLDGGAMGVIFPHIHSSHDAKAAVSISKYPPAGCRSMTGQLPVFSLKTTPQDQVINESNTSASSVIIMIETKDAIKNINEIAAVDGVDVLLIGSNDLAIELGVPGGFQTHNFRSALESVSEACRRHGKTMGLAGIYDNYEIQDWAINTLGVRYMLCAIDSSLIASGATRCIAALPGVAKSSPEK